jgi:hypothetical protein
VCTAFFSPSPESEIPAAAGALLGIIGTVFTADESSTKVIEYGLDRIGVDVGDTEETAEPEPTEASVRRRYIDGELTEDELEDELEEVVARE